MLVVKAMESVNVTFRMHSKIEFSLNDQLVEIIVYCMEEISGVSETLEICAKSSQEPLKQCLVSTPILHYN